MSRKMEIEENLNQVRQKITDAAAKSGRNPNEINLIVVTKTFPISDLEILYSLGVREFGENRDQEASVKAKALPQDINWHFQGGIQSNKLKSICSWASVIHSVDQFKYAKIISEQPSVKARQIFIQVSLDEPPESRGGVDPAKLTELANQISSLPNLKVLGLMALGPVDREIEPAFARLQQIQAGFLTDFKDAVFLSSGMSGDYELAISYGATHLRIGSSILGIRAPIK
ncbi:MAG: YggS family pyridoxal phosphate-dependent enzyme [Actinobacteria bacterium]|nr:YggS family pyridoxal phosphate-dependent enzyme [Actinomycetota bacterium]NDA88567.1 YggS family pyridoxal phosphate-dependent enzyme [Actinomycetota bacterium]